MAAGQHKLSRRVLLAGACALPLARHSGPDPEPKTTAGQSMNAAATPDPATVFMDPGLRRDDGKWQKALSLFAQAEAELEALAHTEDDLYGRALGRHSAALARLLRAPAPDLGAVAGKLDLMVRHQVSELRFGEAAVASLRKDIRRFAALPTLSGFAALRETILPAA
jgi:hypothetical protein